MGARGSMGNCRYMEYIRALYISIVLYYTQLISTLPSGTPFRLLSRRAKNRIIGSISSRFRGMLSPALLHLWYSTFWKEAFRLVRAVRVINVLEDPPSTSTGVVRPFACVQEAGIGPPIEMTPPSSSSIAVLAAIAAIAPCPKPKNIISRFLYPHFATSPFSTISSLMTLIAFVKPVSKSMFPVA